MTRTTLLLLTGAWIATVPNYATLRRFFGAAAAGSGLEAVAFTFGGWVFVLTVTFALLLLVSLPFRGRYAKIPCAIALLSAAALSYFTIFLGTLFDRTMVLNMVQTNANETLELLNVRLLLWILVVGVLPAAAIARVNVRESAPWWRMRTRDMKSRSPAC